MSVEWGKLVSKLTDERDKQIHFKKALRTFSVIDSVTEPSYDVVIAACTFLENYFKYPQLVEVFPEIDEKAEKAKRIIEDYLRQEAFSSITQYIEKALNVSHYTYQDEINIPVFIPDKNKYGGIDLFVWDANGLLIDIPSVHAVIKHDNGFTVTVTVSNEVFEKKEFRYLDDVVKYLQRVKESVQKAVDNAVSNLPEHPVKVPEKLITYLKASGNRVKVIKAYDLHFKSLSECEITPSSVLLKHPYFEIDETGKISWYPEDAVFEIVKGFAKLHKNYVLLEKEGLYGFNHYWVHNEEYGFWRYRFDHYCDSEGIKVYRMSDKYPFGGVIRRGSNVYCLFKIVKVTKKSAWLAPVEDPVSLMLKDIGLAVDK